MVEILTYSVGRQNGRDGPHLDTDDDKKNSFGQTKTTTSSKEKNCV